MDMRLVWLFQSNCKRCHFLFMPWSLSFLSGIPSSLWPLLFYTSITGQRQIILLLAEKKFIYQKQEYVILDLSARSIIDYTDWCNPLAIHVLSFCSEHLPMPMILFLFNYKNDGNDIVLYLSTCPCLWWYFVIFWVTFFCEYIFE